MPRASHLLTLLIASLASHAMAADHLPGRVIRVIDGDSLVLDVRGAHYPVELHGIDAPELNQPWGDTAGAWLRRRLAGTFVVVETHHSDAARRVHGSIRAQDRDVAHELLLDGLAWSTIEAPDAATGSSDPRTRHTYTLAQETARAARRGLWSDDRPVPPWQWRQAPLPR